MTAAQAQGKKEQSISRVGLVSPLVVFVLGLASVIGLLQITIWVGGMSLMGGPEVHVRLNTDFLHMLTGALIVQDGDGADLYDLDTQRAAQNRVLAPFGQLGPDRLLPYNHPPLEALILLPLMNLPYSIAYALWCVAAVVATLLALRLILTEFSVQRSTALIFVAMTLSYHPFHRTLWLGQNSLFVLAALTSTYVFLRRSNDYIAGIFLLPIALMKPQVLPAILLLLVVQWRWRALASFSLGSIGFTIAVMPFLGLQWPLSYLRLLALVATWQQNNIIDPTTMHNWRGFITNSIGVFFPEGIGLLASALSVVTFGVLLFAWWRVRDLPHKTNMQYQPLRKNDFLWGLGCVTAVITSIHLLTHDLSLLLLAAWIVGGYLAAGALSKRATATWVTLVSGNYVLALLTYFFPNQIHLIVVLDVVVIVAAGGWFLWYCRNPSEGLLTANTLSA